MLDDAPQSGSSWGWQRSTQDTNWRQSTTCQVGESCRTQNIQTNKVIGENEQCVSCFLEKAKWTFWPTQYISVGANVGAGLAAIGLRSGCTWLHGTCVPLCPRPSQNLLLFHFQIISTWMGKKNYILIVLMCIFDYECTRQASLTGRSAKGTHWN